MSDETTWRIDDPDLDLEGQFYTTFTPIQAWGQHRKATWYFRAHFEHWDFVRSPFPDYDAIDICDLCWFDPDNVHPSVQPYPSGFVQAFRGSFVRSGDYGEPGSLAAGYMSMEEATRIIKECVSIYEAAHTLPSD